MSRRTLTKGAARVMRKLTKGLAVGEARKIDNAKGTFMAVSVERTDEYLYSVTHYFEQNGDLVPDPDMTFFSNDEGQTWMPCSFQDQFRFQWCAEEFKDGVPTAFRPQLQAELASFANMWMNNIRMQQALFEKKGRAA